MVHGNGVKRECERIMTTMTKAAGNRQPEHNSRLNPRFEIYARSQGMTPCEVLDRDAKEYPGRPMCGFIVWISEAKARFRQQHPEAFLDRHTIRDHEAFTMFLRSFDELSQRTATA